MTARHDGGPCGDSSFSLYHPEGMYFWDSWYLPEPEKKIVHAFYLQVQRPDNRRPPEDHYSIGHAVSSDLLHWKELPVALRRGPEGSYDHGPLFTGCCVINEGVFYLFYTGNGPNAESPWDECICLATSTDGIAFARHPANPLIVPDGVEWDARDARDIIVRRDPTGHGWIAIVVMRVKNLDRRESLRWVLFRSTNLVEWRMEHTVFALPGRFDIFEVPDFFPLGNAWYVIAHNGDRSGSWSDPGIVMGTFVGQAADYGGPYVEVRDNLLHKSNDYQGFSARTLEWQGRRLMLYGRNESYKDEVAFGRMSLPVELTTRAEGGLRPLYWHGCDALFHSQCELPEATVEAVDGWRVSGSGMKVASSTFQVAATVHTGSSAAAGIAIGESHTGPIVDRAPWCAVLDAAEGAVAVYHSNGKQRLRWPILPNHSYSIRLFVVEEMVELYVDDELIVNCYTGAVPCGHIGFAVTGGSAAFANGAVFTTTA